MVRQDLEIVVSHLLTYRNLGFSVIPLQGKLPLVKWKQYTYRPQDFIKPGVNIGVKAGPISPNDHLYFLDFDDKNMLGGFYEEHPNLTHAALTSTSRGFHVWLSWKEPVKTRVFNKGEIRGSGSYVVVPPSIHPNGHVYKFIVPLKGLPPTYNPEWLSANPRTPTKSFSKSASVKDTGERVNAVGKYAPTGVPQGQRHNSLIFYLGAMHNAHFTEEEAMARVLDWNTKNNPPLTKEEVVTTVRTAWEKWDVYRGNK